MQPTIHLAGKAGFLPRPIQLYVPDVLWVAFSIKGALLRGFIIAPHIVPASVRLF
jgi:hypothetical protein